MHGLKERLNTAEIEIPLNCPSCGGFVGKDLTFYVKDDGTVICSRCYHDDRVAEISSWEELPDWVVQFKASVRRVLATVSIRGWMRKRRELQAWAWTMFHDCWKNPREVQRRVAELRHLDRWQQRVIAGLDT